VTDQETAATVGGSPNAVDVARLMAEIKARVQERKAAGLYSEEEVRRVTRMELEVTESAPGFAGELEQHLAALNDGWDTTAEPVITTHRGGLGRAVVLVKRLLRRLTRPYISMVLQRQVQFNGALLHLLNPFVLPVRDQLQDLQRRLQEVALEVGERQAVEHGERQHGERALAARLDALAGELTALRGTLDRLRDPAPGWQLSPVPVPPPGVGTLPPASYVRFEDRHRGSREEIRHRQRDYLALFGGGPVLDVGCGRGEFLELCREAGLPARGIDVDAGMVARCREAGLDAVQADALAHLSALPDGTLGGIFCAQVIEHLPAEAFVALVRLAHAKLAEGGALLCETPNPACLTVFSGAFYVDLTHVKPIHPEAARFVLEAAGFGDVEVRYVNPYPPEARLQPVEPLWYLRRYEAAFLEQINDNFERLNQLLWGAQDYAVVGVKR
jgi:O-antigen chain-terminating methyltransferase